MSNLKAIIYFAKNLINNLEMLDHKLYPASDHVLEQKSNTAIKLARLLCERLEETDQALDVAQKLITMQQELHECDDAIIKLYEMKEKSKGGIL